MNRVVLLTGASSGIGAATALHLAERYRLALVARRRDRLEELVARIRELGGEAVAFPADLGDPNAAQQVVESAAKRFGALDVLVNNAGRFETAPGDAVDAAHIGRLWRLNVEAPMLLARHTIPHLRRSGGGWIVNVSSMAADATFAQCSVYSATKSALETWSRVLRDELRGDRIRVGVVAPGATDTDAWPAGAFVEQRARMCRPEDVARAIRFVIESPATASIDRVVVAPPTGAL